MPTLLRRLVRWLVGLVIFLVVLVAGLLAFSQTATFRGWLVGQVVTRLNDTLAGRVSIGRLDGNLLSGLVLTNLRVTLEGARVLAVRRVTANYDLLQLVLARRLVLRAATIDGLDLHAVEDARGWNVARLVKTREEQEQQHKRSTEIVIESLALRDGALRVVRPKDLWRLRGLALDGDLAVGGATQKLHIAGLSFELPDRGVRLARLAGSVEVGDDGAVTADGLVVKTDASDVSVTARIGPRTRRDYDVDATVTRLSADEVQRVLGPIGLRVDVAGTMRAKGPASAVVVAADLATEAGSIALDGTVDVASTPQSYDLHLALQHVNAAGLLGPAQPVTDVSGTVSAKGKGTTFEAVAATFAVALSESTIAGKPLQRANLDGSIAERTVQFEASAATPMGSAQAGGTVDVPAERYDLRLAATDFDPAPFVNRPDLTARINATATVTGTGLTAETARADAHVELGRSRVQAIEIREAHLDARADRGWLTVERLALRSSSVEAEASGALALSGHAGRDATVRYQLESRDLRPLATVARVGPLSGSLKIAGTAHGSLRALTVDATVAARRLARESTTIGAVDATVHAAELGTPTARADVSGHAADVHAGGQAFRQVDLTAHWQQQHDVATVSFDVRATGLAQEQHALAGTATLGAREKRVEIATLRTDLGGDTWTMTGHPVIVERDAQVTITDLTLRSPRGVVAVAGRAGTSGPQDLTVTVDGLDLRTFARAAGEALSGRITLRAHLGGTAAAPRVDADASVTGPVLGAVRYETIAATVQVGGGRATVSAKLVQAGSRQLTLDATAPVQLSLQPFKFAAGDTLNGNLRAHAIDLAFMGPMVPQVAKLRGTLDADLTIAGRLAAPDIRGPITISGGKAYIVPAGVTYDPIELRARVDGQALSVETLKIVSDGGTFTGGGNARRDGDHLSMDLRFELTDFPLFKNQYGRGAASGWIWASGTTAAPVVAGSLETNGLVLQIPEVLPGSVRPPDPTITVIGPDAPLPPRQKPDSEAEKAKSAPTPSVFDQAAITLQIDVPRNAWIRRSDANVELRGWMTVWKKPGDPVAIAGEINTVRGWYTFQGKKFTITEGQVVFTGQDFDPLLSLTATYQAGEYTVRVIIGGRMTKPTLTLESDPPLEQADILSVLLFGKPASELNQAESKGLREQAIGVAGSYVAGQLRQSVADALGVDNLEFDTGGEGLSDARVSLGKYVAPDIFVSLSHKFGKQAVEEIRIEYTLTPSWSIETSTDTRGDSGADIFWKRRY